MTSNNLRTSLDMFHFPRLDVKSRRSLSFFEVRPPFRTNEQNIVTEKFIIAFVQIFFFKKSSLLIGTKMWNFLFWLKGLGVFNFMPIQFCSLCCIVVNWTAFSKQIQLATKSLWPSVDNVGSYWSTIKKEWWISMVGPYYEGSYKRVRIKYFS